MSLPQGQEALEAAMMQNFIETLDTERGEILAKQYAAAEIISRDFTGSGFYLNFYVPASTPTLGNYTGALFTESRSCEFDNRTTATFVLGFDQGRLSYLDGQINESNDWPTDVSRFSVAGGLKV